MKVNGNDLFISENGPFQEGRMLFDTVIFVTMRSFVEKSIEQNVSEVFELCHSLL